MKEINLNVNGVDYIIIDNYGSFSYYKIINGEKLIPSIQELRLLIQELQKMNNISYSIDELKQMLLEQINNDNIKNEEDLKKYLDSLNLESNYEELQNFGMDELKKLNIEMTPVEILRDELLQIIRDKKDEDKIMDITFDLKKGLDNEYMEISLYTKKDDVKYDFPKKYVPFDENIKRNLIEPVMREIILKNKILMNKSVNINSLVDYRANYFLKTANNYSFNVLNIEQYYAVELQDMMYNLQFKYGYENDQDRIDQINEDFNEENLHLDEENNRKLDEQLKLVRVKPVDDKNGFVNLLVIVGSEFFAGLFILLQIILS